MCSFFASLVLLVATVTLERSGDLTFGDMGIQLTHTRVSKGWKETSAPAGERGRYPDPKTGSVDFVLASSGVVRARGRSTLRQRSSDEVSFVSEIVAVDEGEVATVGPLVRLPARQFSGRSWSMEGERDAGGRFPDVCDSANIVLKRASATRLTLETERGSLVFAFDRPVTLVIQDDRVWRPSFSVRIDTGIRDFQSNAVCRVGMDIQASGLRADWAVPVRIEEGAEWVRLDYPKDIVPDSALDFSGLMGELPPAGSYGWLRNVDGHFEFERRPGVVQRFYGANLCFSANYPEADEAERIVTRLRRMGYNSIRLHHFDKPLYEKASDHRIADDERVKRIDRLIAEAIRQGLYIASDLFVSRSVDWADVGLRPRKRPLSKELYKVLVATWEPAMEDWKRHARDYLLHCNPETGRRYIDEPAIPLLSLVNEGPLTIGWGSGAHEEPSVRAAYARWLERRRTCNPQFMPYAPETIDGLTPSGPGSAVFAVFMRDLERETVERQVAFLRELGARALFTNCNCGPHFASMQPTRAAVYGYGDAHCYIDHPTFPEGNWRLPSVCSCTHPVRDLDLPLTEVAFVRVAGQPFCSTEWNFSGPSPFRGSGALLFGTFAALQDWSGLWRFAYSHDRRNWQEDVGVPEYFDVAQDPLAAISERLGAALFLRGDVPVAPDALVLGIDADCDEGDARHVALRLAPSWKDIAWRVRVATATDATVWPKARRLALRTALNSDTCPSPAVSSSVPVFDRKNGYLTVDTSRTAALFAPDGYVCTGPLAAEIRGGEATLALISLDSRPLRGSQRQLLLHLTDVQASGNVFSDRRRSTLTAWGHNPPLVRDGSACVSVESACTAAPVVWKLDLSGRRLARVPARVAGGRLTFDVSVRNPEGAVLCYEIVR